MEGCYRDRHRRGSAAVGEELSDVAVILEEVVELDDVVRRERRAGRSGIRVLRAVGVEQLRVHRRELVVAIDVDPRRYKQRNDLAVGTLLVVTVLVALVSEIFVESVQKAAETFGMSPAFVGFVIVSLVGAAAEFAVAFSAARKDRLDMSVSIALGSASQIALFVAPALVLLSYVVGPSPMSLQFWPGAVTMVMIATVTASFITSSGRSAWFIGALLIFIYAVFALTLYVVPPAGPGLG